MNYHRKRAFCSVRTTFIIFLTIALFTQSLLLAEQQTLALEPLPETETLATTELTTDPTESTQKETVKLSVPLQAANPADDPGINFTRSGAYTGQWSVCLDGMRIYRSTSSILFSDPPKGTYSYTAFADSNGWIATPSSGYVTIAESNITINIAFTALPTVTFTRTGSYTGQWSVCFEGNRRYTSSSTIQFPDVPNGTYYYTVYAESNGWTTTPSSGTVTITGSNANVNVAFTTLPTVTFTQTGYTGQWSVCLNGMRSYTSSSTITFTKMPNGSYYYTIYAESNGWTTTPSSGTITITGSNVTIPVAFTALPTVTFTRTGFTGQWSVFLNGMRSYTSSSTITFTDVPNGAYSYRVCADSVGWTAAPPSGTVTISGSNVTVPITFTSSPVPTGTSTITITQTGLPTNTQWGVSLAGSNKYSTTNQIQFTNIANGAYPYVIITTTPYTGFLAVNPNWQGAAIPTPPSGSINLQGTTSVNINFAQPSTLNFSQTGLTSLWWAVSANGMFSGWQAYNGGNITWYNIPQAADINYVISSISVYASNFLTTNPALVTSTYAPYAGTSPPTAGIVNTIFSPPTTLTFMQTGLGRDWWSVSANGMFSGWTAFNAGNITFYNVPQNADINYVISDVTDYIGFLGTAYSVYYPSTFFGSTTIPGRGSATSISATFRKLPTATFVAMDLPTNGIFRVSAAGVSRQTYSNSISFLNVPYNNTLPYDVNPPSGYYASPSNGSLSIDIFDFIQLIGFTTTPPTGNEQISSSILSVKVTDTGGKPVSGVFVTLYDQKQRPIGAMETDSAGDTYPVQLPSLVFIGVATQKQPYYTPTLKPLQLSPGSNTASIQLVPYPKGTLNGYVSELNGTAISGALVTASQRINGVDFVNTTYTSSTGQYSMTLLAGPTGVRVSVQGHYANPQNVTVPENGTASLNTAMYLLEQGYVRVNIFTKYLGDTQFTGPMPIDLVQAVHFGIRLQDATGNTYTVTQNPFPIKGYAGETVKVTANGYEASLPMASQSVTLDGNRNATVTIFLSQQGLVKATVKSGSPPQPVSKWIANIYSIGADGSRTFDKTVTNNSASLAFYPPNPGRYEIDLQGSMSNGNAVSGSFTVAVQQGQVLDVGTIVLQPAIYFTGTTDNTVTAIPYQVTPGQELEIRATYHHSGSVTLTSANLLIEVPSDTSLVPGSITLNNQQVSNPIPLTKFYKVPIGTLTGNSSGVATYQLRVDPEFNATALNPTVLINYFYSSQEYNETIGTANILVDQVTIEGPSVISSLTTRISGQAPPNSKITIYDNDTILGQISASTGGYWQLTPTLPEATLHGLHAQALTPQGTTLNSTALSVIYDPTQPQLILVTMQQRGSRRVSYNPQLGVAQFPYVFVPNVPIIFELTFTSNIQIWDVYVAIEGADIANATLDSDGLFHASVLPTGGGLGSIYIGYSVLPFPKGDGSFSPYATPTVLPPVLSNAVYTVISNTTTRYTANLTLADGSRIRGDIRIITDVNYTVTASDIERAQNTGYPTFGTNITVVESPQGKRIEAYCFIPYYALPADLVKKIDKEGFWDYVGLAGQLATGILILITLVPDAIIAGETLLATGIVQTGTTYYYDWKAWGQFIKDVLMEREFLEQVWGIVFRSGCWEQQTQIARLIDKFEALVKKLNNLFAGQQLCDLIMGIPTGILEGMGVSTSHDLFVAAINDVQTEMAANHREVVVLLRSWVEGKDPRWPNKIVHFPKPSANPKWVYDPSGYVYEGLDANRIANVTASIFYQDQQTGQWILWDATEYGQQNNQLTDPAGNYGWYVPQGKWMVTYTKSGYQTTQSPAYDVPPPVTDVNIGLTPLAAPTVTTTSASTNALKIGFNQYMKASSLNQNSIYITIGSSSVSGIVSAFNPQQDPNGNLLATVALFTPTTPLSSGNTYSINVDKSVQNFAGISMLTSYSSSITVQPTPTYQLSTTLSTVSISGPISAVAETTDPMATKVAFSWIAPDGTCPTTRLTDITNGRTQSNEFFPDQEGLWTIQAKFTDGNNLQATKLSTFQVVKQIPNTLSVETAITNAVGGFTVNSTKTNGIYIYIGSSSATGGTTIKATSFVYINTPPGRNATTQLGTTPSEYAQIAIDNAPSSGMTVVSITSLALKESSSIYYYSGSNQAWVQASKVAYVASDNPFGPGTIRVNIPVSELEETTIAVINASGTPPDQNYNLTIYVNGNGTVTPGNGTYLSGTTVTIQAFNAVGWRFSGWSGDLSGNTNPTNLTMTTNKTVAASFTPDTNRYTITFTETGLPPGTAWNVTFNGVTTSSTTSTITFTNISAGTYQWSTGTPITGGSGTRYNTQQSATSISVPSQTAQTVTFKTQYQVSFAANPTSSGTVTPTNAIFCDAGATLPITATGSGNYIFQNWSSTTANIAFTNGNTASTTATVNGPGTITASFNYVIPEQPSWLILTATLTVVALLMTIRKRKKEQ